MGWERVGGVAAGGARLDLASGLEASHPLIVHVFLPRMSEHKGLNCSNQCHKACIQFAAKGKNDSGDCEHDGEGSGTPLKEIEDGADNS